MWKVRRNWEAHFANIASDITTVDKVLHSFMTWIMEMNCMISWLRVSPVCKRQAFRAEESLLAQQSLLIGDGTETQINEDCNLPYRNLSYRKYPEHLLGYSTYTQMTVYKTCTFGVVWGFKNLHFIPSALCKKITFWVILVWWYVIFTMVLFWFYSSFFF